jgi:hypothetical protein
MYRITNQKQLRREMVNAGTWADDVADFPTWETLKIYKAE